MHMLGLIFAWILVVLFTIGFLGSSLIALEGLWDGLACFARPPQPRGLPAVAHEFQRQETSV